ncbi:MAG: carboxypeptidase-like regulatory domain-containing protein [Kofleriaceae bacterium]
MTLAPIACHSPNTRALKPAGAKGDDGHGILARASTRLMTSGDEAPPADDERSQRHERSEMETFLEEGDAGEFGGTSYGGNGSGGPPYATYRVPPWQPVARVRSTRQLQRPGLTGSVEGVVHWRGAIPSRVTTTCGTIEQVNVSADRSVAGVVVVFEPQRYVRSILYSDDDERGPPSIGGAIVKRGCALMPSLQPINPVPAALTVQGDAKRATISVRASSGEAKRYELQAGGRVVMPVGPGLTSIHDVDSAGAAPAWVFGIESPYYAITDDRGRYRIDELSPGTYRVTIVQPPIAQVAKDGKPVFGTPEITHRTVAIDGKRPSRLDVTIDLPAHPR